MRTGRVILVGCLAIFLFANIASEVLSHQPANPEIFIDKLQWNGPGPAVSGNAEGENCHY